MMGQTDFLQPKVNLNLTMKIRVQIDLTIVFNDTKGFIFVYG